MEARRLKYLLDNIKKLDFDEQEELNNWYQSFDKKPDDTHLMALRKNPIPTQDRIYKKILTEIKGRAKARKMWSYGIAASVACILSIGVFLLINKQYNKPQINEVAAGMGEQKYLKLEDGTEIWLNAQSKIMFPIAFSDTEREVSLSGEAYFKVEKDSTKPFRVVTDNLTTSVLGTEFNVNAYKNQDFVSVALVEGSVRLRAGDMVSLLGPGQKGSLKKETSSFNIEQFDVTDEMGWMRGELIFNGVSLGEIAKRLKRSFGIEIEFAKKGYATYEFTGKFKDEELSIILTAIARAHELKFRTVGDQKIEFYK
ncbi:hypothetical protein DN752_05725 [Echinicola strongylocentroti]|uniref:FecR family protein n=1 Tax=Echinicola strongylocentroti TaxID=1795355 RepID=A0A2Z4IFV1_9BACT|nr:FecR domain-containing protein [Echinicola strongylocentroti]AWW29659.1 hypothetical protein DN752_05725 [Echinicola strongylocentroti]